MSHPLLRVRELGQSIWFDNLSRDLVASGELGRMVAEDGLYGVTSNPAIFQKAIAGSDSYDAELHAQVDEDRADAKGIFEALAIRDIQLAADALRPAYDATEGRDGFVSLEVSPYLSADTAGTIAEARRLSRAVARDNLLVKVPATPEGLPAIEALIGEGIGVNVTLLFSVGMYERVSEAYLKGLERLVAAGGDPSRVASVASFFVSRIDAKVDARVLEELDASPDPERKASLEKLVAKVAIANAVRAYARYRGMVASERWQRLEARGAQRQRLLWASTSTKNPEYAETLYVDALVAPETVNTLPGATYEAFKASGSVPVPLSDEWEARHADAEATLARLADVGIDLDAITDRLLEEGVQLFADAFDTLLGSVETRRAELLGTRLAGQHLALGAYEDAITEEQERWRAGGFVRRLWARDASLWTGGDEASWLGWLDAPEINRQALRQQEPLVDRAWAGKPSDVVVLGMGGSSLCPDVLAKSFGRLPGAPRLHVLDSTVPAQVERLAVEIDLERTLFVVSSKSGSTIEPNMFLARFWAATNEDGARFLAVTDPGSALEARAERDGFLGVVHGEPSIGGRFSALSPFGVLPARLAGIDAGSLLSEAERMARSCSPAVPPAANPGVALGLVLGTLARAGRDKLTLVSSESLTSLGGWLEQLIAESTGKAGLGIVPIDGETLTSPEHYGDDRLFVSLELDGDLEASGGQDKQREAALRALEAAGHPVVRIELADRLQLGQEFFRWEMATAVAGAVLGINPFDQPDVEAAKVAARQIMADYEQSGRLPEKAASLEDAGLRFYTDPGLEPADDAPSLLRAHLARLQPGDYFAINAYLDMQDEHRALLQSMRHAVRDARGVATTLGFGPRFLHSTGQLHKGGPQSGLFLQISADDPSDPAIPGQGFGFGVLKDAQGGGDFQVLIERGRRAVHVRLGRDTAAGLRQLEAQLRDALASR